MTEEVTCRPNRADEDSDEDGADGGCGDGYSGACDDDGGRVSLCHRLKNETRSTSNHRIPQRAIIMPYKDA